MTTTARTDAGDRRLLAALGAACAPLVAWYDHLEATGEADVGELDDAVLALKALAVPPPAGSRLGWAVALVLRGGVGASTEELVAAVEALRGAVGAARGRAPGAGPEEAAAAAATPAPRRRCCCSCRRAPGGGGGQPFLPGLGPGGGGPS